MGPMHLPAIGDTPARWKSQQGRAAVSMCGCVNVPKERLATTKAQVLGELCSWCKARVRAHTQLFNAALARAT